MRSNTQNMVQIHCIMLIVFFGCAGVSFPYPILAPLFLNSAPSSFTHFLNLQPEVLLGLVIAAYPLGMIIGSTALGAMSDRIGRKKLLSFSLIFTVLGYLLCAFAITTENYLLFLVARFAIGLCEGNVSVARAMVTDLTLESDKSTALSKVNAAVYAGLLSGPILGGAVGALSIELVFVFAAVVYLICWLIVLFWVREHKRQKKAKPALSLKELFTNKLYCQLLVIQLLMAIGTSGAYHFIPVWLTSIHGLNTAQIGLVAALMSALMILSSLFLVSRLTKRLNKSQIYIIFGVSISMLYLAMVTLPTSFSLSAFLLTGIPISILSGTFPAYVVDKLGDEQSGLLLGSLSSMTSVASVFVAITGSLSLTFSHSAPMVISALFCGLSVFMFVLVSQKSTDIPSKQNQVEEIYD